MFSIMGRMCAVTQIQCGQLYTVMLSAYALCSHCYHYSGPSLLQGENVRLRVTKFPFKFFMLHLDPLHFP